MTSNAKLYKTEAGKNLLNELHDNYWDVLTGISEMCRAIRSAYSSANANEKKQLDEAFEKAESAHDQIASLASLISDKTI